MRVENHTTPQVLYINHDLGNHGDTDILDGRRGNRPDLDQEIRQRKAFLRELDAMVRLRSPHTVNVFGAITSLPNRLVLVMELLARGDLRTLLKNSEQPLLEEQCQRIVRDICAGMTFLHGKKTVHGDLKSANVLLDGAGRAKVRPQGCRGRRSSMKSVLGTRKRMLHKGSRGNGSGSLTGFLPCRGGCLMVPVWYISGLGAQMFDCLEVVACFCCIVCHGSAHNTCLHLIPTNTCHLPATLIP